MTITFSQTARDLVTGAMQDLGVVGLSEAIEAEELDYGLAQLDLLLKGLAAEGVTPWSSEETTVAFASGTSEVTLSPRPLDVLEARLQVSSTYDRPLTRWSNGEYDEIPNKSQAGEPLAYEILHTTSDVKMRVWPVPNTAMTIAYSYHRVLEDIAAGDAPDVPQMWLDALRALLRARMTAFMPQGMPTWVIFEAQEKKRILLDYDRPESYMIEPDRAYG